MVHQNVLKKVGENGGEEKKEKEECEGIWLLVIPLVSEKGRKWVKNGEKKVVKNGGKCNRKSEWGMDTHKQERQQKEMPKRLPRELVEKSLNFNLKELFL
jgi:hypothetical protein